MGPSPRIESNEATGWHVAAIALIAAVSRVPLWLAAHHLTFDEGVFLASTDLANHGLTQYRDFFASQGPLFIPLLQLGDLAGFGDPRGARTIMVLSGVAIAVSVYFIAMTVTSRARALALGLVAAVSGAILHAAGPVQSEGPALALVVAALAVILYREDGAGALLAGALAGAALATKSLHVTPTVLVIAIVVAYRRHWLNLAYLCLAAFAVGVGVTLFFGVEQVWDQYILFHLAKDNSTDLVSNLGYFARFLFEEDPALLLLAALSLISIRRPVTMTASSHRYPGDAPPWLAGAWLAVTLMVMFGFTTIDPGFVRVMAMAIPPIAYVVAVHTRLHGRLMLGVAVAAIAWTAITMDYDREPAPETVAVVDVLQALDAERPIVTDDPGLAWTAGRLSHPDTVDPSFARFNTGYLTAETVEMAASDPETCAYLATSERFESVGVAPPGQFTLTEVPGVYVRTGC